MDCLICANPFNKSTRSKIQCFSCDFASCKECVRTFLKTNKSLPKCMNCNTQYQFTYLVRNLNRSWVFTGFKENMKETLLSIELGKQTETLPYAEAERARQVLQEKNTKFKTEITLLNSRVKLLTDAVYANSLLIRGEDVPYRYMNELTEGSQPIVIDTRKKFIMSCPGETCRGFLSSGYKCGLCNQNTCSACLIIKQEGHVCQENDKLTAVMIKTDTKPCPQCGTRIYKIDGCDQMFCTAEIDKKVCETAFSWKTGEREKGRIHNPHYYELRRKQGNLEREVGDVECGGMPTLVRINRLLEALYQIPGIREKYGVLHYIINEIRRTFDEFEQYGMFVKYMRYNQQHDVTMRNFRVHYILNKISSDQLAEHAYRENKEVQKNMDLHHVMELVRISILETYQSMHKETPRRDDVTSLLTDVSFAEDYMKSIKEKLNNLMRIKEYCNDQFKEISITYNCTVQTFNEYFRFVSKKYNMNGREVGEK